MKIKCGNPSFGWYQRETVSVKDKEKPELLYTTNESILWCNYNGNKYDSYLKIQNRFTI